MNTRCLVESGILFATPHFVWVCRALSTVTEKIARSVLNRRLPQVRRDQILLDAAVAFRAGRYDDAARVLDPYYRTLLGDAAYLNLLGTICEKRGDPLTAGRLYQVANTVDVEYLPARANLARCAEVSEYGYSERPIMLGDRELRSRRAVAV